MFAVLALAFLIFTLIVRALPLNYIALFVAVGSPYVFLVAVLGLQLSVVSRRVVISVIAVAITGPIWLTSCPGIGS